MHIEYWYWFIASIFTIPLVAINFNLIWISIMLVFTGAGIRLVQHSDLYNYINYFALFFIFMVGLKTPSSNRKGKSKNENKQIECLGLQIKIDDFLQKKKMIKIDGIAFAVANAQEFKVGELVFIKSIIGYKFKLSKVVENKI
jgi:membrane protein implicated in regulation of membrane protease activity